MSLRFASQLNIDALPAEALDSEFEVVMPSLNIIIGSSSSDSSKKKFSLSDIAASITAIKDNIVGNAVSYNYAPIVEAIQFTPRKFKVDQRRIRTQWINVASDLENIGTVQIIMFCSSGMLTQYYLDAWRNLVFDKDGEYYNPMQVYKKNIEVYFYGATSIGSFIPVAHFTLKGCFPISQDQFDLKYSNKPERLRISATFSVDRIVTDSTMARSAAIKELGSSPLSIADRLFQSLSSSSTNYSVSDTTG